MSDNDMLVETDEITRRRIDDGTDPDYGLVIDIKGWRTGTSGNARWVIVPVAWTQNIDPEDNEYLAEILEKVIEVLRPPEPPPTEPPTHFTPLFKEPANG